jgi:hypothetical protein
MRNKKESDEEFLRRVIDKQFELNGYLDISYDILVSNKEAEDEMPFEDVWYRRYTTTKEKEQEFKEWLEVEMKKRYKYLRGKALRTQLSLFLLMWGLKCDNCFEGLKN